MYLKSIEMQGFKSFAGKMKMEFQNGVTGIVGPNGSGKSNVADAVRWVLGEQSAKQLRGGNMQDVIFSGTESRKPLGFASVAITLDNSDHALDIEYPEVTVTRRLYRSGESEYLLNNAACRLRDIQELFYDTGIGKEGYSIIGQGQIDKIISEKPEDRRELFDEAAGIVKFKRRKNTALKKLENEEQNLLRVTDVLTELTRQVGPLEKQSEKARIYLSKREELKKADIAMLVLNEEKNREVQKKTEGDLANITSELEGVNAEFTRTKEEYDKVAQQLQELDEKIGSLRNEQSDAAVKKQQLVNQIELLQEQINSAVTNREVYENRVKAVENDKNEKEASLSVLKEDQKKYDELIAEADKEVSRRGNELSAVNEEIEAASAEAEKNKSELIKLLEARSGIHGDVQKYKTLVEQIQVQEGRLSARILTSRKAKTDLEKELAATVKELEDIDASIEKKEKEAAGYEDELASIKKKLFDTNTELEQKQLDANRAQSLLESLTNIAERYEGYGNSVKKIMEQKNTNRGILGVVAELIETDKKYETAIEIALGGSLQNIVTDNEATAKYLIEYLKRGKYGRATFLPLTSMNKSEGSYEKLDEPGVIGVASDLVKCDEKYRGMVNRLLGRTYIIDTVDHAIGIGRRYNHRHRMVTLEGEFFNAGGSITGGAYKNNANLLGRKRQIEELEKTVAEAKKSVASSEARIKETKERRNVIRDAQSTLADALKSLYLEKNTKNVRIKVLNEQIGSADLENETLIKEREGLRKKIRETESEHAGIVSQLEVSNSQEEKLEEKINKSNSELDRLNALHQQKQKDLEDARIELNGLVQKKEFGEMNIAGAEDEIKRLAQEAADLAVKLEEDTRLVSEKSGNIDIIRGTIEAADEMIEKIEAELSKTAKEKETLSAANRDFIDKRDELANHRSLLEKESYRLEGTLEKIENEREASVSYLWEEYNITPASLTADPEEQRSLTELKKAVSGIRKEIRDLGSVNVNAIEEYKEVKERYDFLSVQYEDIVKAAENLKGIIAELDKGMKKQFAERFADIQKEFDSVFKQMFGGGKGTIELVEGENILDTGVTISAQPPGKKLQNIMQLSGGEKALTAIALLFAIQNLKPSPFCLLDEIEAALDEANVITFANYLHKLTKHTQFIVITHRRGTMMTADQLYGITMQEKGISAMVSVDLVEGDLE